MQKMMMDCKCGTTPNEVHHYNENGVMMHMVWCSKCHSCTKEHHFLKDAIDEWNEKNSRSEKSKN